MKVALLGAGICGSSAAMWLSRRGHSVTVYEQFVPGHVRGSSHGESRIVRRAYPDVFYTRCMAEAYPLWEDLQAESGEHLLTECGLAYFGLQDDPVITSVQSSLTEVGVPFETLHRTRVKTVFPELSLSSNEVAVFTPGAGWVHAALALATIQRMAQDAGAVFLWERRVHPSDLISRYDVVLVCMGAWTKQLTKPPVEIRLMTYGYLQSPATGPVWIEQGPHMLYGFPATALGTKIGVHAPGQPLNSADDGHREPSPTDLELIRDFGRRRFGADASVLHAQGCLYTMAPNEDFILGRIGENGFYASACSGHGFKFGPWIGKLLADFAEGQDSPERWPRFQAE